MHLPGSADQNANASTTSASVQYAFPRRQVLAVVGGVGLLIVGITAAGVWLRSPWLVVSLGLAGLGGFIWLIAAKLNATGEATLDEAGIQIVPRHRAICAPRQTLEIAWENVTRIEAGVAEGIKTREYVILRILSPRLLLTVMPLPAETQGFVSQVMKLFNASRARAGKPAVAAADPMSGVGWRVTAGIGLAVFAALVIGAALNPGKFDAMMIGRITAVGGFVLVLAAKVFGARRGA